MNRHTQVHNEWIDRLVRESRILGEARMLRDDQDITPEITQAIIRRFEDFRKRTGSSLDRCARSMGYKSESPLSQVVAGTYAASDEHILRKMDKWLEVQLLRESAPVPANFVRTGVAAAIHGFTKQVVKFGGIGVIHGPAGCGKTMAAQYLLTQFTGSILVRITTAGSGKLAVLDQIAQQLRLTGLKLTAYQVQGMLFERLTNSDRLIIVDEAHKLIIKRKDEGLHTLRDLHDETGCPIILLGTANLGSYINDGRAQFESLDQISSREAMRLDLTEVIAAGSVDGGPRGHRMHSVDDITKLMTAQQIRLVKPGEPSDKDQINLTQAAVVFLCHEANRHCGGCLRGVKFLLLMVRDKYEAGDLVDVADVQSIQERRLGKKAYAVIRTVEDVTARQQERQAAVA